MSNLSDVQKKFFINVLLATSFTFSISQSAMTTIYPTLMKHFSVPISSVQWLTTGFMLIMVLMMPLSPWFLKNINFKAFLLSLQAIFIIGTVIAVTASNFALLMVGRLLEGIAVGLLFPSFQSVILSITPIEKRSIQMGSVGLVMGSALAVGPIVSGVILQIFNWQAVFGFFLLILVVLFFLSLKFIKNVIPKEPYRFDLLSSVTLIGLLMILYALQTMITGLSLWLIIMLVAGIVLFAYFIRRQLTLQEPLLDIRVLKNTAFRLGMFLTAGSYIALIVTTVLMPLYFQKILAINALWSGLLMVPAAVSLSILNRRSATVLNRFGLKRTMTIGSGMIFTGFFGLFATSNLKLWLLAVIFAALVESGNAFMMMPAVTYANNALKDDLIPHGTALITTVRQIAGVIGVLIISQILVTISSPAQVSIHGMMVSFAVCAVFAAVLLSLVLNIKNTKNA
ncbi:multidrug efflux MFS transporter [Oenococcus sicerae]|uniref:Multidrug efflux MFS transporter n=1 Tax=Oenococcus sicerae TaxID=2203724 RepID=A0ABX5QLW6_9LACO|nr:MFS transporter [Oenococcus sicerae]QAS69767.1 multidrug efflux MFS transporter [Oenococcus sicerae]